MDFLTDSKLTLVDL